MRNRTRRESLYHFALALPVLLVLIPVAWTFLTSIKYFKDIVSNKFAFTPTLFNFINLFVEDEHFGSMFANSLAVALMSTIVCLIVTTLGSYSLSRFKWNKTFVRFLFGWSIAIETIPAITIVIPIFMAANTFDLIDTKGLLVLVYSLLNLPFTLMLMYSFFNQVPKEIEESALMDGAREWTLFLRIILPLTKPILLTSALFAFILSWKDFLMALNLTSTPNSMTLNVKISAFIQSYSIQYGNMTAAAVLGAVPGLLFAIFAQRYIVAGILSGAIKE